MEPPAYFEPIRLRAAGRWSQLEADPELAGPWHQLFAQVQSPRHVLSELLQNADDAGATEAFARVENDAFVFEHNGSDFTEEHFGSLCRFGYSNKRALHTIGFRGVGFKSTFSLGDRVELFSPTLAVVFEKHRFTEPIWLKTATTAGTGGKTRIRVQMSDPHRMKEVERNLDEWMGSAESLLFFKNIRRLQIHDRVLHWGSMGRGPSPNTEWMGLHGEEDRAFLLVRSEEEEFPDEAVSEIRQERMVDLDQQTALPPCRVELLLGAAGRLFVVLPTGVKTNLPFACNAPFLQDPARLKIKDPETSPTNRWLLRRAGRLAASTMLEWLSDAGAPIPERVGAYGLLPDIGASEHSLESAVAEAVSSAFREALQGRPLLLTDDGQLVGENDSVVIPRPILETWSPDHASALFDERSRPPLCRDIAEGDQKRLQGWGLVAAVAKSDVFETLSRKSPPKPQTWRQLLDLWSYLSPQNNSWNYYRAGQLRILPVQGQDKLFDASKVVRLGEKRLLQSEADWNFLAEHLTALNQNWTRFLAEQRRLAEERQDRESQTEVETAYSYLRRVGLDETSDVGPVIDQFSRHLFGRKSVERRDCVQLAQIAAKLDAKVGDSFRYVTQDESIRPIKDYVLFDPDGGLEALIPESERGRLLHPSYVKAFTSCTRSEWFSWVACGRAGLLGFAPRSRTYTSVPEDRLARETELRGGTGGFTRWFRTTRFELEDFDFAPPYWQHWEALAEDDPRLWTRVTDRILTQPESYWTVAKTARLWHVATTGNRKQVTDDDLLPNWIRRLGQLPCLSDSRGQPAKPQDLLRRTPETLPLLDVEAFVHDRYDIEANRPLLDLLGVRSVPTGPESILSRLRALAQTDKPPLSEVEKWYRRLDRMVDTCSTETFQSIREALDNERLVLTHEGSWATALSVFLQSDEDDVPGAALVRASVSDLTLWRKVGIAERPTADLAIQWLRTLPSGEALQPEDAKRVRALLIRHPNRIWQECGHWMNLAGEWAPVAAMSYSLTMQSLIAWKHLHPAVKSKTLDLQRLPGGVTSTPPFSTIPLLSDCVDERLHQEPRFDHPEPREWLTTFGAELSRVELDTEEETRRVRACAERLENTLWLTTPGLEIVPYVEGVPAGTARPADVLWKGETLYVDALPSAKLARRVPAEIAIAFGGRQEIQAALDYSFERSSVEIRAYLEANFRLTARALLVAGPATVEETSARRSAESMETRDRALDPIRGSEEATATTIDGADAAGPPTNIEDQTEAERDRVADHHRHPPKPTISVIERFARAAGYRAGGDHRWSHPDGRWIAKANGDIFPWELRSSSGEVIRRYWPREHCLELAPLEVPSEVWAEIERGVESCALILVDPSDRPVEVTAERLRVMKEAGAITLYPAKYRLVWDGLKALDGGAGQERQ